MTIGPLDSNAEGTSPLPARYCPLDHAAGDANRSRIFSMSLRRLVEKITNYANQHWRFGILAGIKGCDQQLVDSDKR